MTTTIENPEFYFVKEVQLDLIEIPMSFDIYRNTNAQYLVVMKDKTDKSSMFYHDFDLLKEVYSDDFSDQEIDSWR